VLVERERACGDPLTATRPATGGTTLTELTVAMVVFGLFATMLATTALQATRLTRESLVRSARRSPRASSWRS
jgi:type II secretory pathway pseudopilin PulG